MWQCAMTCLALQHKGWHSSNSPAQHLLNHSNGLKSNPEYKSLPLERACKTLQHWIRKSTSTRIKAFLALVLNFAWNPRDLLAALACRPKCTVGHWTNPRNHRKPKTHHSTAHRRLWCYSSNICGPKTCSGKSELTEAKRHMLSHFITRKGNSQGNSQDLILEVDQDDGARAQIEHRKCLARIQWIRYMEYFQGTTVWIAIQRLLRTLSHVFRVKEPVESVEHKGPARNAQMCHP